METTEQKNKKKVKSKPQTMHQAIQVGVQLTIKNFDDQLPNKNMLAVSSMMESADDGKTKATEIEIAKPPKSSLFDSAPSFEEENSRAVNESENPGTGRSTVKLRVIVLPFMKLKSEKMMVSVEVQAKAKTRPKNIQINSASFFGIETESNGPQPSRNSCDHKAVQVVDKRLKKIMDDEIQSLRDRGIQFFDSEEYIYSQPSFIKEAQRLLNIRGLDLPSRKGIQSQTLQAGGHNDFVESHNLTNQTMDPICEEKVEFQNQESKDDQHPSEEGDNIYNQYYYPMNYPKDNKTKDPIKIKIENENKRNYERCPVLKRGNEVERQTQIERGEFLRNKSIMRSTQTSIPVIPRVKPPSHLQSQVKEMSSLEYAKIKSPLLKSSFISKLSGSGSTPLLPVHKQLDSSRVVSDRRRQAPMMVRNRAGEAVRPIQKIGLGNISGSRGPESRRGHNNVKLQKSFRSRRLKPGNLYSKSGSSSVYAGQVTKEEINSPKFLVGAFPLNK